MESELIGGRFRLHRLLGSGAMGQVWLTTDERLERSVAVKVVVPTSSGDQQLGARLEREARAAAAIQHTNVVRVFDYIEDGNRTLIVMEYVEGETLADRLESGGAMTLEDAVDIAAQVCDGLAAAHRSGLVHRDLKPSNVMITEDGVAKVLDFGIAKRTGGSEAALTMTGAVIGTPRYMAPEQLRGDPLDARVDVHAMGLLLFEMLTGRAAFHKVNFAELMYQIVNEVPDVRLLDERGVPAEITQILLHATQKAVADRWPDAKSMADALRVCLYGEVIRGRKTPIAAGLRAIIDSGERVLPLRTTSSTPILGAPLVPDVGLTASSPGVTPPSVLDATTPLVAPAAPPMPEVAAPAAPRPAVRAAPVPAPASSKLPLIVGGVVAVAAVIGFVVLNNRSGSDAPAIAAPPVADATAAAPPQATPNAPVARPPATTPATTPAAGNASKPTAPADPAAPKPAAADSTADSAVVAPAPIKAADAARVSRLYGNALQAEWTTLAPGDDIAGTPVDALRAEFAVSLNSASQLADVNPVSPSGNAAFDDAAGQVVQTLNAARLALPKREDGWSLRVRFSGRRVRVVVQ